jgi:hypothetical protein
VALPPPPPATSITCSLAVPTGPGSCNDLEVTVTPDGNGGCTVSFADSIYVTVANAVTRRVTLLITTPGYSFASPGISIVSNPNWTAKSLPVVDPYRYSLVLADKAPPLKVPPGVKFTIYVQGCTPLDPVIGNS